jgi:hypothetical protein
LAIFTKDHLQCLVVSTKSVPPKFDLLVLSIKNFQTALCWLLLGVTILHQHRPVPYLP